uniref:ORF342 n=1 Tax=Allomyces macrogynus TaxID=28583 RepID=Q33761_ALLMA
YTKVALPYSDIWVTNLAICWHSLMPLGTIFSKNSRGYTQSAGNDDISSSETTCKTPFNFSAFYNIFNVMYPLRKGDSNYPSSSRLEWFIGFAEGDGAILAFSDRLRFVLTQKEGAILYQIQRVLGFGNVVFAEDSKCYRYIVDSYSDILILFFLFHGNLVLSHRISQLKVWYDRLLTRVLHFPLPTSFNSTPILPSLRDAWVSGFTDAEGCFTVSILARKASATGFRVVVKFLLDQKNAFSVLMHIRDLFGFGSVALRKTTNGVYRYTANSFLSTTPIINYFTAFPLKTKKAISYNKWLEIVKMVKNGDHLTKSGLEKVRAIAVTINNDDSLTGGDGSSSGE